MPAAHVGTHEQWPDAAAGDLLRFHDDQGSRTSIRPFHEPLKATGSPVPSAMPPRSYQTKPWPIEALLDGWCPLFGGAHILFGIVVNETAACPLVANLLVDAPRAEISLARLAVIAPARTWDLAARCRNQGGLGSPVLDISFPRRTGIGKVARGLPEMWGMALRATEWVWGQDACHAQDFLALLKSTLAGF